jgi:hypothetical protein
MSTLLRRLLVCQRTELRRRFKNEWHLNSFLPFSHNGRRHDTCWFFEDLLVWDCKGELKVVNEFDEKCLHLEQAGMSIDKPPGVAAENLCKRKKTHANLHPMQPLKPPPKLILEEKVSIRLDCMAPQHRDEHYTHKLEKTPTLTPFFTPENHLSGLKTSGSSPNISSFLVQKRNMNQSCQQISPHKAEKEVDPNLLYSMTEAIIFCPFGIGSSFTTFPFVSVIDFESGRTSSAAASLYRM